MLSAWCEEESNREVLVVTGGVSVGHSTSIYCQMIDQGRSDREEIEAALSQAEAAEAAAKASQEEVERLKKIISTHAEKEAKLATEAEEKRMKDAEAEAAAAKMLVPRLGGLRSMFEQKNAEIWHTFSAVAHKGGGMHRQGSFRGVRLSQRQTCKNHVPFEPGPSMHSKASSGQQSDTASYGNRAWGDFEAAEPLIVCIRQISVAASLARGTIGPSLRSIVFMQRRFSYVHEYFENKPLWVCRN